MSVNSVNYMSYQVKTTGKRPLNDRKARNFAECPSNMPNNCRIKGNKYTSEINLNNTPRFAINYIRHLIYTYFRGCVPAVSYNFVDGVEIWLKAEQQQNTTKFHEFSLNPQHARITDSFELLVTYEGISTVYKLNSKDVLAVMFFPVFRMFPIIQKYHLIINQLRIKKHKNGCPTQKKA